jgi:hypothetical protein
VDGTFQFTGAALNLAAQLVFSASNSECLINLSEIIRISFVNVIGDWALADRTPGEVGGLPG